MICRPLRSADLLGRGTACLIWSSLAAWRFKTQPALRRSHVRVKTASSRALRQQSRAQRRDIDYASSTQFYLADKAAGTPWVTRLPFPVHVVERVETYDRVSRNRFVTRYTYHHGFYDRVEREFHGFGRVDQTDTEEFAALKESSEFPLGAISMPPRASHRCSLARGFTRAPIVEGGGISRHMAHEYYGEGRAVARDCPSTIGRRCCSTTRFCRST